MKIGIPTKLALASAVRADIKETLLHEAPGIHGDDGSVLAAAAYKGRFTTGSRKWAPRPLPASKPLIRPAENALIADRRMKRCGD
jgi:hypothetical protein